MTIIKINDPYERGGFILTIEDDIPPEQLREITDFLDSDTRKVWAEDSANRRHVTHSTDALIYEGMDYAAPDTAESILLRVSVGTVLLGTLSMYVSMGTLLRSTLSAFLSKETFLFDAFPVFLTL